MKKSVLCFLLSGVFALLFLGLIAGLCLTKGASAVGFYSLNRAVSDWIGFKPFWYNLTEVLGLAPLLVAAGFGCYGLFQWVKGKSLKSVDKNLFVLAGIYGVTAAAYVFFEIVVLNYRPVLMDGQAEASFPSSHTVLVFVIMGSAAVRVFLSGLRRPWRTVLPASFLAFALFLTAGRLLSGVHWLTDILGGLLFSGALVLADCGCVFLLREKEKK